MIPPNFTYLAPRSMREALDLLQRHGSDAKLLAGGQSLIPLMKLRLAAPAYLIDLGKIPGLDTIHLEERDGDLVLGAMVRETALEHSPLIQQRYAVLADASSVIADPIVRNFATVGGNLAHADPANDHPAVMLALRAQVVATGPKGQRRMAIDDFFVDTFQTALAPEETLLEIRIPQPPMPQQNYASSSSSTPQTGSAYVKLERKVGDYAIAAVAAQVTLFGGVCAKAGLGLTNVGPQAIRPSAAEQFLTGKALNEETIRETARLASEASAPTSDLRGSAEYKRAMVRTLTARALRRAHQRALGGV